MFRVLGEFVFPFVRKTLKEVIHPIDVKHDVVLDMLENLHKFGVKFIIRDFVSQLVPKALKEVV